MAKQMNKWEILDTVDIPNNGGELKLMRRAEELVAIDPRALSWQPHIHSIVRGLWSWTRLARWFVPACSVIDRLSGAKS